MKMTRQAKRIRQVDRSTGSRTTPAGHQVNLHIGELVLQGFPGRDRLRIARAMEQELARLLREQGPPQSWQDSHDIERIDGGHFKAMAASGPAQVGRDIAKAVHRGLCLEASAALPGVGVRHR